MHILNTSVWIAGLVLQCFLLVALFLRRVARRLPIFTALLSFYVVRSILLYSLSGHLAPDDYGTLYNALSLADFVLQIVVAGELALCVVRGANRRTGSAWIKTGLLIVLAVAIAAGAASRVSVPGRYPPDRGMAFVAILMLFLVLGMIAAKVSGPPRRVAEGFAFYGAIGTLAGIERAYAAIARDARAFTAWSYTSTTTWLVVVLFWILALRPDTPTKTDAKKNGPATKSSGRARAMSR
jgi:peptidoglycan/LPS O-acetylase OafA/YrhL